MAAPWRGKDIAAFFDPLHLNITSPELDFLLLLHCQSKPQGTDSFWQCTHCFGLSILLKHNIYSVPPSLPLWSTRRSICDEIIPSGLLLMHACTPTHGAPSLACIEPSFSHILRQFLLLGWRVCVKCCLTLIFLCVGFSFSGC